MLAICYTDVFIQDILPDNISVIVTPVIKIKTGKITSKENCRPIALACVISKVFENVLFNRLEYYVLTNANQFGFKSKQGTYMCIYALKEMVLKYWSLNSTMFLCFLDASKAFDRINHLKQFEKLLKSGTPGYLIRILIFWYSNQTMMVRWSNNVSAPFTVSNGVRQGGILSRIYLMYIWMTYHVN